MANSGEKQVTKSMHWLPPGWMVELKERSNGGRDQTYIDPVSGYKFRSKQEVLRYLGIIEPETPKKRDVSKVSGEIVIYNRSAAIRLVQDGSLDDSLDWLPFNWQVELSERRNLRVDRYYIDPVSGYKFRSRKEVSHYLQTGEMPKRRGKRRMNESTAPKFGSSGVVKKRKLAHCSARKHLLTEQISNTSDEENHKRVLKLFDLYASDQSWKGMKCYSVSELGVLLSNIGDSQNRRMDRVCAEKDCIVALSAVPAQKQPVHYSVEKSSNKKQKPSPRETENGRKCRLALRTSRRLAGLEPELAPEMEKGKHVILVEPESTDEVDTEKLMLSLGGEENPNESGNTYKEGDAPADYMTKCASKEPESGVSLPRAEVNTGKDVHSLGCGELPNELEKTSDNKYGPPDYSMKLPSESQESETAMPGVELNPEKDVHTLSCIQQPNGLVINTSDEKDSPAEYPMKPGFKEPKSEATKPTVEVGTGKTMHSLSPREQSNELVKTSEIKDETADFKMKFPFDEQPTGFLLPFDEPSEFTLPFGEPSLDPCLEFAYKTLTGIIPLENLPIKDFLYKHVTSVSTQGTGSLKWQDIQCMANLSLD